jgi:hypothetical protein
MVKQSEIPKDNNWVLSPSVRKARDTVAAKGQITASVLVEAILNQGHRSGYAGGRAAEWSSGTAKPGDQQTADDWLAEIQQLFDPALVRGSVNTTASKMESPTRERESSGSLAVLHGRLAIVGLAMLDESLRRRLQREGILTAIQDELEPPVEEILSDEGQALLERGDQVSPLTDAPLESADADRLRRADFASYLAERIAYIRLSSADAFSILLYGPWGSGKSTLFNFLSEELLKRRRVLLSKRVERTVNRFPADEPVSAAKLANAVLKTGRLSDGSDTNEITPQSVETTRWTPKRWLEEVRTLFDHDQVQTLNRGRVVLGLVMLEPSLREQIESSSALEKLADDRAEPLDELLSERGRVRRKAFSRDLENLGGEKDENDSSAVDKSEQAWQIVRFNAWQHQHVSPPWWALMDRVFNESKSELRRRDRYREYGWRLSSRRLVFLVGITLLAWVLVLVVLPWILPAVPNGGSGLHELASIAGDAGTIIALLVTIWAGIEAVSRPLFLDSARAAQSYVEHSREPMTRMQGRFTTLVDRIPKHLLIFIDDLDRCQSEYVVELLEGIQTLFKDAPVIFVIAGDNRWVDACFEEIYQEHTDAVRRPGKRLGMLFSEKAFQMFVPVPGVPDTLHESYLNHLINVSPAQRPDEVGDNQPDGASSDGTDDEAGADGLAAGSAGTERSIRRDVKWWALPEAEERTEHLLQEFRPLFDQNPRSMKQLVNTYTMNRALAKLTGISIDRKTLVLWTILSLRWPGLSTHLVRFPDDVEKIRHSTEYEGDDGNDRDQLSGIPSDLRPLFTDPAVVAVVTGAPESVEATLDVAAVRRCAHLSS